MSPPPVSPNHPHGCTRATIAPLAFATFSEDEHRWFICPKSHSLMKIAHPEQEQQDHLDDNNETYDDDLLEEDDEEDDMKNVWWLPFCFIIIIIQIHHQ
jgi:hypothetical protein